MLPKCFRFIIYQMSILSIFDLCKHRSVPIVSGTLDFLQEYFLYHKCQSFRRNLTPTDVIKELSFRFVLRARARTSNRFWRRVPPHHRPKLFFKMTARHRRWKKLQNFHSRSKLFSLAQINFLRITILVVKHKVCGCVSGFVCVCVSNKNKAQLF